MWEGLSIVANGLVADFNMEAEKVTNQPNKVEQRAKLERLKGQEGRVERMRRGVRPKKNQGRVGKIKTIVEKEKC